MSEFEKWFEDQDFYTNMRFIHGDKLFDKDGGAYRVLPVQMTYLAWLVGRAGIKEMDEVIKLQDADLRKYEKQIEGLKEQLNNMEACYIEKKRERDELQGQVGEAMEEIQRALNCCESTETACVLGELVKVLRGES